MDWTKTLCITTSGWIVALIVIATVWLPNDDVQRRPLTGAIRGAGDQPGEVRFEPMGPPERPAATARIYEGRYIFDRSNGPCSGLYRVSVVFEHESNAVKKPMAVMVPESEPWVLDI
ncbi:MAG: hypothetical protein R3C05_27585 [Pirellulaceae bacterium]